MRSARPRARPRSVTRYNLQSGGCFTAPYLDPFPNVRFRSEGTTHPRNWNQKRSWPSRMGPRQLAAIPITGHGVHAASRADGFTARMRRSTRLAVHPRPVTLGIIGCPLKTRVVVAAGTKSDPRRRWSPPRSHTAGQSIRGLAASSDFVMRCRPPRTAPFVIARPLESRTHCLLRLPARVPPAVFSARWPSEMSWPPHRVRRIMGRAFRLAASPCLETWRAIHGALSVPC